MFVYRLVGPNEQLCKGASKRRKKRREGGTVTWDDSCTTDDLRQGPTDLTKSFQLDFQRRAQPTLTYDLRQQRPGTYRPSGLVKLLHN